MLTPDGLHRGLGATKQWSSGNRRSFDALASRCATAGWMVVDRPSGPRGGLRHHLVPIADVLPGVLNKRASAVTSAVLTAAANQVGEGLGSVVVSLVDGNPEALEMTIGELVSIATTTIDSFPEGDAVRAGSSWQ